MSQQSDIEFIKTFNNCRVPCTVTFDSAKGKHVKVPAIAEWTMITPDNVLKLEDQGIYGDHSMFITGDTTGQFVIDIDRKNAKRKDHDDKVDGVEFFEDWCGPVISPDTFTTKTIGGGYHKVYQICDELKSVLKSGPLKPYVLIDILHNNRAFTYGKNYSIVNKLVPQKPSRSIITFITINQNNTVGINNSTFHKDVNIGQASTACNSVSKDVDISETSDQLMISKVTDEKSSISSSINDIIGSNVDWKIVKLSDAYQLVPSTKECCVETDFTHSEIGHSCIYVHKTSVVLNCFSHGKKILEGRMSKYIRELFFTYKSSTGIMTDIVERILDEAKFNNLVRTNGNVIKLDSYTVLGSYELYLKKILKNNAAMKEKPRRFNELMIYMDKIDDDRFPFVTISKQYIRFNNGILDILNFKVVSEDVVEKNVIPRHYINQHIDIENLNTPLFDKIVRHQLCTDEIYTYFMAFIGRLFYDVGQFDKLDIMPFIIGDNNTGKSTVVDIICSMFAPSTIGVIDSTHEIIFGLQSKYNNEVIVAPEINNNMVKQLSSDVFKKMITGDRINIPTKYSKSTSVQWKVPMFMCGNIYLSYQDDKGSISKRLAIFVFDKYVEDIDNSLKEKIISTELPNIIVKSITAYWMLLDYIGNKGFWNVCPEYFKENRDNMNESTDYIHMFLSLGPDDNAWSIDNYMYFIKEPDSIMLLEDFKKKFFNWMRFKHRNTSYKWTHDYSAFKRKGFEIVRTKICKVCQQESHINCCKYYDHANRTTRIVIKHIKCIENSSNHET